MAGLYPVQAGAVLLDGLDIRQMTPHELRNAVTYFPQNRHLFHGTIAQNLRLAAPAASDDELKAALAETGALNDVLALPDGLHSGLGDHSAAQGLSTGLLQRIALARLYLRPSAALLLDEPGQWLDEAGDAALMKSLHRRKGQQTIVIVSHRPSHLAVCDRVVVMQNGRIAEISQRWRRRCHDIQRGRKMSDKLPAMHADPSRIRYLTLAIQLEEGRPPRLMQLAVWLLAAIVACAIGWAAITKVAQVARAPGEIVPNGHTQPVQHLEGGIVREAVAREGDLVEAGQVLVRLDHTGVLAELEQLRTRERSLRLQAERLRAFAEGRIAALEDADERSLSADQAAILLSQEKARLSQRAVLERQLAGRRADLEALLGQQKTLQRQIAITGEALDMRQTLTQQGLNSRLTLLDIQREMNRVQGELSTVTTNIGRARESVAEAEQRLIELETRLSADAMRELGAITSELRQVEEARVKLEDRVARTEITSPVRGIIKDLRAYAAGAVIPPAAWSPRSCR